MSNATTLLTDKDEVLSSHRRRRCCSNFTLHLTHYLLFLLLLLLLTTTAEAKRTTTTSFIHNPPLHHPIQNKIQHSSKLFSSTSTSTSANFALDPESSTAHEITSSLSITPEQHELLIDLSHLIVEWNERLNLISRKDCTVEVVFGRHVLPSVALAALPEFQHLKQEQQQEEEKEKKVIDVGTGGGFPGLPLAILFPHVQFTLVDSVGKKLKAVQDMADELQLSNVQTHHGRAEEMVEEEPLKYKEQYDVCVGRSVAALSKFCFWIEDLLKQDDDEEEKKEGKLVYIIGGELESSVTTRLSSSTPLDLLLNSIGASDKNALVLGAKQVKEIAKDSGFKKQKRGVSNNKKKSSNMKHKRNKDARGGWVKKDNSVVKQRGYDDFKRFDSSSSSSSSF